MKNKTISINEDIDDLLKKETNASKLINDLLNEHYGKGSNVKKMLIKQIEKTNNEITRLTDNLNKFKDKLNKIKEKETVIKSKSNNIPKELIEKMKRYNKLHLQQQYLEYKELCSWEEVKDTWKAIWGKDWTPVGDQEVLF